MKYKNTIILWMLPFLFAFFPILSLFSQNIGELELKDILSPILTVLAVNLIALIALRILKANIKKSALIISLFWLLFFSYGHIFQLTKSLAEKFFTLIPQDYQYYLLVFWIYALVLAAILIIKTKKNLNNVIKVITACAIFMNIIPLINIGLSQLNFNVFDFTAAKLLQAESSIFSQEIKNKPNIYYLILDAYAREDVLKEFYNFNNSEFINFLQQKGFYVADKSYTNYSRTYLSLASSLNYEYLDPDQYIKEVQGMINEGTTSPIIKDNKVFKSLKSIGYQTIHFDTPTSSCKKIEKADIFYTSEVKGQEINIFKQKLLETTPLPAICELWPQEKNITKESYDIHRQKILFSLEKIKETTALDQPFIAFAHIYIPHQPFVFNAQGEEVNPEYPYTRWYTVLDGRDINEYIENYLQQLSFANKAVTELTNYLLTNSKEPPIIIIQADHGPASRIDQFDKEDQTQLKERQSILNAYYFPDQDYSNLYESISPVNSFRVIFNKYFQTNMDILEDKSYHLSRKKPYELYEYFIQE